MTNLTVRMKPTTLTTLDGATWDNAGWQTVYANPSGPASTTSYPFIQPIYYDGVSNMLVDISFNNASASTSGSVRFGPTSGITVMNGTSNSLHGNPLDWAGANGPAPQYSNERPSITYSTAKPIGPFIGSPAAFSGGAWTGTVSFPVFGNQSSAWLRAQSPSGVAGFSNRVGLIGMFNSGTTETLFSDNFESGTLSNAWDTSGGSGTPRVEVSAANAPRGNYHLQFDSNTSGNSFSRSQATITLNLANRKNVTVSHYAKGFADEANSAPALQPFNANTNFDGIAISPDGTNWYLARSLAGVASAYGSNTTIISLDPILQQYGLSYSSAFRIKFVQYDDQAIPSDGIAIDDVSVQATVSNAVIVELPATLQEGRANVPVTVRLPATSTAATTVTLSSIAPGRLVVPASVSVPAGSSTATILVSTPDNFYFDGGKSVYVVASASWVSVTYTRIVDDEIGALSVTPPVSVTEGGPNVTGTVSVTPMPLNNVVVALSSSDPAEATVPASVTIAAGGTSANFAITPVNDTRIDGTQNILISASGMGVSSAAANLAVLDNESTGLTLTLPTDVREGGPPGAGLVSIAGTLSADLVVSLFSEYSAEATVPATVTILAGQTSATFPITPVDDLVADGVRAVNVSASAAGFSEDVAVLSVKDNDTASFTWAPVPNAQVDGVAFPVTLTARDLAGDPQIYFGGSASLTARSGATSLPMTPAVASGFVNGVWTGNVAVVGSGPAVFLTAQAGSVTGSSNVFFLATPGADTDGDGMDDAYEAANGLNPADNGTADPLRGPLGDLDGDGLQNLLECGFNTAANVAGTTGLPTVQSLVNPADGERYPVVTYRRRISAGALRYFVESSSTLSGWAEPAAAFIEQIGSPVPTGDGVTETVQFRLQPSFDDSLDPRFLRVGVRIVAP